MTYQDLVNIRVNCNKSIESLREAMRLAEEAYIAEHFDNSIIGYPVNIKSIFYPQIACGGRYIITKVKAHSKDLFDLTLVHVNSRNVADGDSYTIYGIALSEIERVTD